MENWRDDTNEQLPTKQELRSRNYDSEAVNLRNSMGRNFFTIEAETRLLDFTKLDVHAEIESVCCVLL